MKLYTDLPCSGDFQKAHWPVAIVSHLGISGVVADDHVIAIGEVDYALEKIFVRHCGRGIVRIVDPQYFCMLRDIGRDRLEVGKKMIFLFQREKVVLPATKTRADVINWVARTGYQDDIPRVDEGHGHVANALLRSNKRNDFFPGI